MPKRTQSNRDIDLRFDGHRITGFAAVEDPVVFPAEAFLTVKVGADGTHYNMDNGDVGGPVMVHLASTSSSIKWVLKQFERRRTQGALDEFRGAYAARKDFKQLEMKGCSWMMIPPTWRPGQDFSFQVDVETFIPNPDIIT